MENLVVGYGSDPGRGPSVEVFKRMPDHDKGQGILFWEDFQSFSKDTAISSNLGRYSGSGGSWITFEDTSCTFTNSNAADFNGAVILTTDNTDNNEVTAAVGDNNGGAFTLKTSMRAFAFEARIQFDQVVTQNFFIGMGEKGLAVTDGVFTDSNAFQTKSLLGWSILAAASATMKGTHGINGTATTQETTGVVAPKTIVADTWYKFGVRYEPRATDGYIYKWYLDGVNQGGLTAEGSNSPSSSSGVTMTPLMSLKNSSTAVNVVTVDWVRAMLQF